MRIEGGVPALIDKETFNRVQKRLDLMAHHGANSITYTEEDIVSWLKSSCKGDLFDMEFRRRIIDIFINSVYL